MQIRTVKKTQNHFKLAFGTDVHSIVLRIEYCTLQKGDANVNNKLKHYFPTQTRKLSN